ncbi:MAG: alpha/beta fold hydrolase, partial [Rikenellaceae bacterium]|nr:alpha/beta fold hydrolase [Rikenellaceae bacterium]
IKIGRFDGKSITDVKDIMEGEAWDVPMAPYFDMSEVAWNNEGTQIAYSAKKLHGYDYAVSTNSDIYLYDIASGKTRNLTEGMPGYDRYPVFSPSDRRIAWTSMARPGNEADKERLFVMELATGEKSYITKDFDYNAASVNWADNNTLYFIAPIKATHQICKATVEPRGDVEVITEGLHDYVSLSMQSGRIAAEKTTLLMAAELFEVDPRDGEETQLSFVNKHIYDSIKMASVQKRWIKTTDGKEMLTWVVLPPDFDPNKTYPTLLYCQGGPQSVVSQRWSYRWNLALMASQGYVVVAPNRRGLPSFGQEWLDQISGDYSGQNIRDYLSAIDEVSREPWVDKNRRGCVGASYGGYSTYYLAGHHQKRFKAFISHCGMFNLESFYGSTEELWFPRNDLGGPYWSNNATAKRSYANSPHKAVAEWDTPIMIMVGQLDYRIPYTESLQAFTAARSRGLDSRLVFFEDEGHQVFKPQNSLVWHNEFFGWLDKYVKNPKEVKRQPRPEDNQRAASAASDEQPTRRR